MGQQLWSLKGNYRVCNT